MIVQADAARLPFKDQCVDLVLGSPLYCDARTYGINAQRDCASWVDWMLIVVTECMRVSRGPVVFVAAGVTRDRNYWPACEGLMWEWWKRGGDCQLYRPCIFERVGIAGSGGSDWFRSDWEYVMCFKRPGPLPFSDNTAMGHPPKWAPGGDMSHRLSDGSRVNQWGHSLESGGTVVEGDFVRSKGKRPSHNLAGRDKWGGSKNGGMGRRANGEIKKRWKPGSRQHTKSRADGSDEIQNYTPPAIANPGTVIQQVYTSEEVEKLLSGGDIVHCLVGGGVMGDRLCHVNEAPYPEKLAEFFVRSLCPVGGMVLDPFSGSGTTKKVAEVHGRRCIGSDIRMSQCELTKTRTAQQMLIA